MGFTSFAIPQELKDDLAITSERMGSLVDTLSRVEKLIDKQNKLAEKQNALLGKLVQAAYLQVGAA